MFTQRALSRNATQNVCALLALPILVVLAILSLAPVSAQGAPLTDTRWSSLINKLARDGFDKQQLTTLFSRPEAEFDSSAMGKKMTTLYKRKYGSAMVRDIQSRLTRLGYNAGKADGFYGTKTKRAILGYQKVNKLKMTGKVNKELQAHLKKSPKRAPAGFKLPQAPKRPNVYSSIITQERLQEAKEFYTANLPLLKRMQKAYGVPPEVAVGLLTVETRVGKFLGEQKAFSTLASMSVSADYPTLKPHFKDEKVSAAQRHWIERRASQKADWAYKELKALLRYASANGADPLLIPGSIYGAIGVSQFMPTSALKFGVDGNNDGKLDLFDVEDAVFSMGNYLSKAGWKHGYTSRAAQRRALYRYNHSKTYVNTILTVADHLKKG